VVKKKGISNGTVELLMLLKGFLDGGKGIIEINKGIIERTPSTTSTVQQYQIRSFIFWFSI
jgi:hypothetical protein